MTDNVPSVNNFPNTAEFQVIQTIAKAAHDSGLYKTVGSATNIFMILLAARELGIGPMIALNGGIWNIQGRIEISPRLMNNMIRRAGHKLTIKGNEKECEIVGERSDTKETHTETYTWDMATKAGLSTKDTWKKYPEDMLFNRCMSRLARRLFPDVIGNAYVKGETTDDDKLPQAECEVNECKAALHEEPVQPLDPSEALITPEQNKVLLEIFALCRPEGKDAMVRQLNFYGVKKCNDLPQNLYKTMLDFANDALNIGKEAT